MTDADRLRLNSEPAIAAVEPARAAGFRSILFGGRDLDPQVERPACFPDLNLDQVVDAIVGRRDEHDLAPFFHTPLPEFEAVEYRHEVFRDLEADDLRAALGEFGTEMRKVRAYLGLAEKQMYALERQRWFLDAAATYCALIQRFVAALARIELGSDGFCELREYLAGYHTSEQFTSLHDHARGVLDGLATVRYTLRIRGGRVTVDAYAGERDYAAEIEETFARFREGAGETHAASPADGGSMNHVEAQIAELASRLHPVPFAALTSFCERHGGFVDPVVARFDREVRFYLAYREYIDPLVARGLPFCYPTLSGDWSQTAVEDGFDIALAARTATTADPIVANDFMLRGRERTIVVTGPNQGGKTTFARMVGQLHHLAALGVPVPARTARLVLADRLFTLFGSREDIATLRGRLDDELVSLRQILAGATSTSLIILNEVLASTALRDAVHLGTEIAGRIVEVGSAAVWVTFVDELAALGPETVSMVACVQPDDPSERTFRIARRPADGRAYAWAIAEKYGLSYQRLARRIRR